MQFVVTQMHAPSDCPSDEPEVLRKLGHAFSDGEATRKGVKLLGAFIAPLEHTFFFLLEADSLAKVTDFLKPAAKLGTANVTPVDEFQKVVRQLSQGHGEERATPIVRKPERVARDLGTGGCSPYVQYVGILHIGSG